MALGVNHKAFLVLLATAISLMSLLPYAYAIYHKRIQPNPLSWLIWTITTAVVFLAQHYNQGGWGAISMGSSMIITLTITILVFLKAKTVDYNPLDLISLTVAILAIPLWYFTSNALYAVAIITLIDLIGFIPTLRLVYHSPQDESPSFYGWFIVRMVLATLALETYDLINMLFPITIGLATVVVWGMLMWNIKRTH